jgi:hypothetical protein
MPFGGITIFRTEGVRRPLYNIITKAAVFMQCQKFLTVFKLQVMTLNNEITTQNTGCGSITSFFQNLIKPIV